MSTHSSSSRFLPYNPISVALARELRKSATPAERKLWYTFLRGYKPHFYFQKPIDEFIVDFYCPSFDLGIEVDGDIHVIGDAEEKDAIRTRILEGYGLKVIRIANQDVLLHFGDVIREIEGFCGKEIE